MQKPARHFYCIAHPYRTPSWFIPGRKLSTKIFVLWFIIYASVTLQTLDTCGNTLFTDRTPWFAIRRTLLFPVHSRLKFSTKISSLTLIPTNSKSLTWLLTFMPHWLIHRASARERTQLRPRRWWHLLFPSRLQSLLGIVLRGIEWSYYFFPVHSRLKILNENVVLQLLFTQVLLLLIGTCNGCKDSVFSHGPFLTRDSIHSSFS